MEACHVNVLILVLVEDGLRDELPEVDVYHPLVLILVLVEDGLRAFKSKPKTLRNLSLNPCSCGGWSQRQRKHLMRSSQNRLNPCSCGGWSQRAI